MYVLVLSVTVQLEKTLSLRPYDNHVDILFLISQPPSAPRDVDVMFEFVT